MELKQTIITATKELLDIAKLKKGDILVVGCSSSEVLGKKIGSDSNIDVAKELFDGIYQVTKEYGVYLACQCCEHLNRALVVERECAKDKEIVNVIPQRKAGGSFATIGYQTFKDPVVLEEIKADAGMDIGDTLIGMHLKKVAVPVRLSVKKVGEANLVCARVRPKYIGGIRATYDEKLS